jgi:uncharacterized membrane protein
MKPEIVMTASQQVMRRWVLGTWCVLFALVIGRQLQQGFSLTQWLWGLCFALPLLLPLPGLIQARRAAHAWATMCVLPYFVVGITESVANALLRPWALCLLAASLLWFFALIGFLRVTPATPTTPEPT